MVITDLELIQSAIELIGGFVGVVFAAFILINRYEEKSMGLVCIHRSLSDMYVRLLRSRHQVPQGAGSAHSFFPAPV